MSFKTVKSIRFATPSAVLLARLAFAQRKERLAWPNLPFITFSPLCCAHPNNLSRKYS